jgi:hypothetical protein
MVLSRLLLLLAMLTPITPALAQAGRQPETVGTKPGAVVAMGYCQLSVTAAALISTCSGGIPAGAAFAWITPETAALRWRDDGTAPTTTVGYPITVGQQMIYSGPLGSLQLIAQSGTTSVSIAFYR